MFFSGFPKIIDMENFPDLQNLTLMGQQITTLKNLDCLPHLTVLCVSESKITAISGLDGCKKLKKLFLYNNKIKKIGNISHLEQLSVLWLNNNNIIAIEGLEKLLYLLDLNLAGNRITEIGNLKTLNLSANCMASLKMGVRKTGSINRDSGIEIPEALMPMIKKTQQQENRATADRRGS